MPFLMSSDGSTPKSHPSRVRGLKYFRCIDRYDRWQVAPFTGAWIEMSKGEISKVVISRRTLHGCVDWNITNLFAFTWCQVAPFTGAWIEMDYMSEHLYRKRVAPFTGAWIEMFRFWISNRNRLRRTLHGCVDWNLLLLMTIYGSRSRTLHGCVDWNISLGHIFRYWNRVAPFTGAWIEMIRRNR